MNTDTENLRAPAISSTTTGSLPLDPKRLISLPYDSSRLFSIMNPVFVAGQGLVVQFIGSNPGEGVSTITRDFALTAAQYTNEPVLLLDFDWGRDSHFTYFQQAFKQQSLNIDLESTLNLSVDVSPLVGLSGPSGTVAPLTFHRLPGIGLILGRTSLALRAMPERTPCILSQPNIWDELRSHFILTVVDSPPSNQSYDGIVLSGSMDAVVLVVRAESTRRPVVENLRDRLIAQGAPLVGLVLNQRHFYIPKLVYRFLERL